MHRVGELTKYVGGSELMSALKSKWRSMSMGLAIAVIAVSQSGCASGLMDGIWGDSSSTQAASVPQGDGSAVSPDLAAAQENDTVAKLYNEGLADLKDNSYKGAIKKFSEVERQYPYSTWATKSIIMQAYTFYLRASYDDTINAANRFITLHPGHKDAPYAYYLIALSNYNRISGIRRDQTATQQALDALEEVERRFPGTPYAEDAGKKVLLARDHLAGKEMEIGRYYYSKNSYLAGINRFKRVVTDYQNSTQTPEALYRLTEGYMALGVVSEAQTAAAILGHNYPNSDWYKDAYNLVSSDGQAPVENNQSWISKAFSSLNPL